MAAEMSPDHTEVTTISSLPLMENESSPNLVGAADLLMESENSVDQKSKVDTASEKICNSSIGFLDLETGPELVYGPPNNPEGQTHIGPLHSAEAGFGEVFYGPMNNTEVNNFVNERISKDIEDPTATAGQCGLYNLGNTCFMNSGLQSLMACPPVIKYFLEHQSGTVGSHSLVEEFSSFVSKYWSGQFSLLYPKDLKTALGNIHGQFKDYRQHDCQEFLALLLDTLNDQTKSGPNTSFFLTHNDLNNSNTQTLSADVDSRSEAEKQDIPVSMETAFSKVATDQDKDVISPMPLTQLRVSPENDLLGDFHLNNTSILKTKMPSIEKFYAKETKTLNTNVLISESEDDVLNFDSSKYKTESCPVVHNDIGVSHAVNEPMVVMDLKRCRVSPKGVKDVNIYADMCNKNVNIYCDSYEENEKVKRSKFDSLEKNFQHQAFSKLNCLSVKNDENNDLTNKESNKKKMAEKIDMETDDNNGSNANENQNCLECKINIHLKFKGEDEQKQEVVFGAGCDVEVDQDTDSVDAVEQDEEEDADTEQDPTEKLNMEEEVEGGLLDEEKLIDIANKRWRGHVMENQSIIVKTFHGQYKSSVKCSECTHVSVTFEPFMYLSVPLPRANERQLCVTYIPLEDTPSQYMLVLDKRDRISKAKEILRQMVETDKDVIMAEVLDHHVARIIDDTTMLRYINSISRKLYAFEVNPFKSVTGSGSQTELPSMLSAGSQSMDVFSDVGTFSTSDIYTNFGKDEYNTDSNTALIDSIETGIMEAGWGNPDPTSYTWQQDEDMKTGSSESTLVSGASDYAIGQWSLQDSSTPTDMDSMVSNDQWSAVTTLEDEDKQLTIEQEKTNTSKVVTVDQWKSCSICLEELADSELLVHKTCGATFCHSCLEMSLLHYGQDNFLCPVCSCAAVMTEDFTQLADSDKSTEKRMLLVDVSFCHAVQEQRHLIGHPRVLYLASQMSGSQLYDCIEKVVPGDCQYTVLLTDAQGTRCSRCVYTAKCTGCILYRDSDVSLRPGDTLCVCLDGLEQAMIDKMGYTMDDSSMMALRPDQPLSINDCIQAFTESEVLDKHNPWFCPRCQMNQCASKSMTVWRCPDVLIIHLKRFVYHDLVSVKIDSEVEFPLEGLNLLRHISGPVSCDLVYDLNSIVCHFGDLNSGHYTCFTKHPLDNEWYYYNDENVTKQAPKKEDFKNAYILMYHRRGADFSMPALPPVIVTEQEK